MHCQQILTLLALLLGASAVRYRPDWKSLDSRPTPQWFDDAKIGIFIHWGLFSAPSFGVDIEPAYLYYAIKTGNPSAAAFMKKNYPPDFTYADFAPTFHAEFFNPEQWADIFKYSHAKYVVLTSKHCEGFNMWPTKHSWNWNSMDVGPKRDLLGDLASAIRKRTDLRFGVYHSMFEWFHPLRLSDAASGYRTQDFVATKIMPEMYELINNYKPDILWSDGVQQGSSSYWNTTHFLAWLYNESPVKDYVATNDRWGNDTMCKHGGYWTCGDNYNPGVLQKHKWESCFVLDKGAWGYRRTMTAWDVMDIKSLIAKVASTVSCGGNVLMNVGPTGDGRIDALFQQRLLEFGGWMSVNEEAIFSSRPWTHQNDTVTHHVWYTSKKSADNIGANVYAITLEWPDTGILILGAVQPTDSTAVKMLGYDGDISWENRQQGGIAVTMPLISPRKMPCQWAWTFKLTHLA